MKTFARNYYLNRTYILYVVLKIEEAGPYKYLPVWFTRSVMRSTQSTNTVITIFTIVRTKVWPYTVRAH
jgi:hypothetical protein